MKLNPVRRAASRRTMSLLTGSGWHSATRTALEALIRRHAGRGLPVVFDFDNTLVCGDIGEATMAILVRDGRLDPHQLAPSISPSFRLPDGRRIAPGSPPDLTAYYEAYLGATMHGAGDPMPQGNGYVWAVEAMEGLAVADVTRATAEVWRLSRTAERRLIDVTPGRTALPVPFFYPEMVELVAQLLRHEFDIRIVSASNVWSVRWSVLQHLNPLLREHGLRRGLAAKQVIGVATLLQDRQGGLWKDQVLVRTDAAYAALDSRAVSRFRLTSRLQFPAPTYSGKVAAIWDEFGRRPWLAAGDSPGDHAMLGFAENRLWIARVDKAGYQRETARLIRRVGREGWIVQCTVTRAAPGFRAELPPPPVLRRLVA